ncbi:MAG: hypothetical protein QOF48_3393 [Verrucomicrobiota bacterium]
MLGMLSRVALFALTICMVVPAPHRLAAAEDKKDKKEEKKPEPPRVIVSLPMAVTPGNTNRIRIRGNNLSDATELRFTNLATHVSIAVKSKTKIEVPKDADARKVGDSQMEVELIYTADALPGTNWFVVESTNGISAPHPLIVLLAREVTEEKEPNGGFKQAQPIEAGKTILGSIKEPADVDVFQFEGRAGDPVRVEVDAARLGSALDSLITIYDSGGHVIFSNDDSKGQPDSALSATLPADGVFFLSIIDAQDRGGPTYLYLLKLTKGR